MIQPRLIVLNIFSLALSYHHWRPFLYLYRLFWRVDLVQWF